MLVCPHIEMSTRAVLDVLDVLGVLDVLDVLEVLEIVVRVRVSVGKNGSWVGLLLNRSPLKSFEMLWSKSGDSSKLVVAIVASAAGSAIIT